MTTRAFKHILFLVLASCSLPGNADSVVTDMLQNPGIRWQTQTPDRWTLEHGAISGSTKVFDGAKEDPESSTFLVSNQTFGGDLHVDIDVSFSQGRYVGVYLDFGQESQSGIWMATGHALAASSASNEVERGYIKTVDNGFWVVRANGELQIDGEEKVHLGFARRGDQYSLYRNSRLIATYFKAGGYPAGPLQIRLTNAAATISRFVVRSEWVE